MTRDVQCSKCGSTNLQVVNRGLTLGHGPMGASDKMLVCMKCGHQRHLGGLGDAMGESIKTFEMLRGQNELRIAKDLAKLPVEEHERYLKRESRRQPLYWALGLLGTPVMFLLGCHGCTFLASNGHPDMGMMLSMMLWIVGCLASLWGLSRTSK